MDNLKRQLKQWAEEYNTPAFIDNDPIQFPRKYKDSVLDAEVSGFLTALISFGNRKQIINKAKELDDMLRGNPCRWIQDRIYFKDIPDNDDSFYRTISNSQMRYWCTMIYYLQSGKNTDMFLSYFKQDPPTSYHYILKNLFGFKDNSCAKRIAMFLRWMVRNDGIVDIGLWKHSSPSELIIPLDTHVHRMALELGITMRKTTDIKTAQEITDYFKTIWPNDPCLGDFALFGYGVNHK